MIAVLAGLQMQKGRGFPAAFLFALLLWDGYKPRLMI